MAAAIASRISDDTTIIGVDSATKHLEVRAAELPGALIILPVKVLLFFTRL